VRIGGLVYVTTPNSLTPWKILHAIKRLATFSGIGLTAPEIFYTVTYGHHWKEYSAREIRDYFSMLSPDFAVEIAHFNYDPPACAHRLKTVKDAVRRIVHSAATAFPPLGDQIEVVVRLKARTQWLMEPPSFL
jgi:hypothetical protein